VRPAVRRRPRTCVTATGGLAAEVAVRTFGDRAAARPGESQADSVARCGVTTEGFDLTTLVLVDGMTGRLAVEPVRGKGQQRVGGALDAARRRLPLVRRALHSDDGGEFLNAVVRPYCRRHRIRPTRGRPSKKDDPAWVDQRNRTAVRRLVGYGRLSSKAAFVQLGRLDAPLRRYSNSFQPIRKVLAKGRVGARVRKRYDAAATPYRRLLAAGGLGADRRAALDATYRALDPVALLAEIHAALDGLAPLAEPDRGWTPALAHRIPGVPNARAAG